jgi:hypothetical protein
MSIYYFFMADISALRSRFFAFTAVRQKELHSGRAAKRNFSPI